MSFALRLVLIAALTFMITGRSSGQDGLLNSGNEVTRVIKLRSSDPPKAPRADELKAPDRLAKRTAFPDPSQIQYDEIGTQQESAVPTDPVPKNLTLQPNFPPANSNSIQIGNKSWSKTSPPSMSRIENSPQSILIQGIQNHQNVTGEISTNQPIAPVNSPQNQSVINNWTVQPATGNPVGGVATPVAVTSIAPAITTRMVAPRFVNLDQIAPVRIEIRNSSVTDAKQIKLIAILPVHAKFMAAKPQPTNVKGQRYEFVIDQLARNRTQEVQIDIVPTEKKPLNIETQVLINNEQNVEVGVRQPDLQISVAGPQQSHTGKPVVHTVTIENRGDGIAEALQLNCELPRNMELAEGQLKYYLQQLAPGESTQLKFKSTAYSPGDQALNFEVVSKGTKTQKATNSIRVYQPQLIVSATGPNLNFVNRDGIYSIQVENTGQVDVTNVELALAVPEGMKVTTVSREAGVDKETGILVWKFERLTAGAQETVQLKAISGAEGRQVCRIAASSQETRAEKFDLVTDVQTRADVSIRVTNNSGPVEVGNQAAFIVRVENKGSSAANGVEVLVELPPSLMPVAQQQISVGELDNSIRFNAVDLKPGETRELVFQAIGVSKGEHVVRGILILQESKRRLIAEDSVFIFETDHSKVTESLKPEIRR